MIIVMKADATEAELGDVIRAVEEFGYRPHLMRGVERNVIGAIGDERGKAVLQSIETYPGVESVVPILRPFKLASREVRKERSRIRVSPNVVIGGDQIVVMAGPCSVEDKDQILETARAVKEAGATLLRGGAFKPRTSPYAFQGLEVDGLRLLAMAREATGLPVITEVMEASQLDVVAEYADVLQVGARNVQNFSLLKRLGSVKKPVLLKRGLSTTIQEFLMSAEYILTHGNPDVILCERGIRTFETATRNTLDLSAVPVLNDLTHLPVVIDPSHGTGHWRYVAPMAFAAVAAGADGLMIEVHPHPEKAQSDGPQSLRFDTFRDLMLRLRPFVAAAGRRL